jgi:hypothetical protein
MVGCASHAARHVKGLVAKVVSTYGIVLAVHAAGVLLSVGLCVGVGDDCGGVRRGAVQV